MNSRGSIFSITSQEITKINKDIIYYYHLVITTSLVESSVASPRQFEESRSRCSAHDTLHVSRRLMPNSCAAHKTNLFLIPTCGISPVASDVMWGCFTVVVKRCPSEERPCSLSRTDDLPSPPEGGRIILRFRIGGTTKQLI